MVEQTKQKSGIRPKFRVNDRASSKDRVLIAKRYSPEPDMRGLAFSGLGLPFFLGLPGVFGMLINNVFIGSASGDFLVLRHIRDVRVDITYGAGDADLLVPLTGYSAEPRISLLGGPSIFGQCVMPTEAFDEHAVSIRSASGVHEGISEGAIMSLDSSLRNPMAGPMNVPLWQGNISANKALMDLNIVKIEEYLVKDWLRGNMDALEDERASKIKTNSNDALQQLELASMLSKLEYLRETGIKLP